MRDNDVDDDAPGDLLSLLDETVVRSIILATSEQPRSAPELAERCGVSQSTIYRRIDQLRERDLVAETTRPKPEGHHETVYASTLERVELEVTDGELDVTVTRRGDDVADALTDLWRNF